MTGDESVLQAVRGQPLRIRLSLGPATGYQWQLQPGAAVEVLDEQPPPGNAAPGDAVVQELIVVPHVVGAVELVLGLVRPWQPDQPLRTRTVVLQVRAPED